MSRKFVAYAVRAPIYRGRNEGLIVAALAAEGLPSGPEGRGNIALRPVAGLKPRPDALAYSANF